MSQQPTRQNPSAPTGGVTARTAASLFQRSAAPSDITVSLIVPKDCELTLDDEATQLSLATRMALIQIGEDCKVTLSGPINGIMTIRGKEKRFVVSAIQRLSILVEEEQSSFFRPIFLIEHPNIKNLVAKIITTKGPRRGQFAFDTIDKKKNALQILAETRRPLIALDHGVSYSFRKRFAETFAGFAEHLANKGDKMRMRIHFGKYNLVGWNQSQLEQSYEDFTVMVPRAAKKNVAYFQKRIGDGELAQKLVHKILSDDRVFESADMSFEKLANVTPKKIILFFCHGYRFELEIDAAVIQEKTEVAKPLKASASGSQVNVPRLHRQLVSQIQVFHATADRTAMAITTISPLKDLDWNLEVLAEPAFSAVPQLIQKIRQNTKIKPSAKKDLDYPVPVLSNPELEAANIEAVAAKTVWTAGVQGQDTVVEVSFMREWPDLDTTKAPRTSCGFSLCGKNWAGQLDLNKEGRRDFGEDHKNLFPKGIDQFLSDVEQFRNYLGDFMKSQDDENRQVNRTANRQVRQLGKQVAQTSLDVPVKRPIPNLLDDDIPEVDALKNFPALTAKQKEQSLKSQEQSQESEDLIDFDSDSEGGMSYLGVTSGLFKGELCDAPPFEGPSKDQMTTWGSNFQSLI